MIMNVHYKKKNYMVIFLSAIVFVLVWANMEIVSAQGKNAEQSLKNRGGIPAAKKIVRLNVKNKLCYVNYEDHRSNVNKTSDLKIIYFVTPTYPRAVQVPELTRLAHTLMHVPRVHWIVADDQVNCSEVVSDILRRSGLPFTHISSPKPYVYYQTDFPRGVANRLAALTWLKDHIHEGVLYFGDDDNTVDLQLFEEIRNTKKVSMFPVGLIGGYGVSTPIVKDGKSIRDLCGLLAATKQPNRRRLFDNVPGHFIVHRNRGTTLGMGRVVAFFDSWPASRTFPVDMAGFAVNIEFLKPSALMPYSAGYEEDRFLVSLGLKLDDIEPVADNCSKILVWHTRTTQYQKPFLKISPEKLQHLHKYESFVELLKETARLGMANLNMSNGTVSYIIRNRKQYEILLGLL